MTTKPLSVVLRADAGVDQGSGHVMRCLTLAAELIARGHRVELAVTVTGVRWLSGLIDAGGFPMLEATHNELDADGILARRPDWVVVDSYLLDAAQVSGLGREVPVLAIVDGELRSIEAALYLEQNLGSESRNWPVPIGSRMLAGAEYALVRAAIREARRPEPWRVDGPPHVVAVMGGTDATGAIVHVAHQLAAVPEPIRITVVAADEHTAAVERELAGVAGARVLPQTPELASVLAGADIVVSASGTSAWEVGTLGIPAVLIAVVGNQRASLAAAVDRGLVLGVDVVSDKAVGFARVAVEVSRLCRDDGLRRSLSEASTRVFDGRGAERVVQAMESRVS